MGSNCCVARDRNDIVVGIETRNDKFFYFNYPALLKEIDKRLEEAKQNNKVSTSDINHFKFVTSQLQLEIDYNRRNLEQESIQNHKRRLIVEVCNGEDFIPTTFSKCKCLVRMEFSGLQKKTKKNINCRNPKFYEIFKYPLLSGQENEQLIIQVIIVEQKDVWKVIAQDKISLDEFDDQIVHLKMQTIPIFLRPVKVASVSFKHRKEISDFSIDDQQYDSQSLKVHSTKSQYSQQKQFFNLGGTQKLPPSFSPKQSVQGRRQESQNMTPKARRIISSPEDSPKNDYNQDNQYLEDFGANSLNEISCVLKLASGTQYSDYKLRLNLRIQKITNAESYFTYYMKQYQQRYTQLDKLLEKHVSIKQNLQPGPYQY